jgi:hypothetical protein
MSERGRRGPRAVGRDPESGDPPLRPPAARTVRLRAADAGTRRCGQRPGRSVPDHPLCSCWSPHGYGVGRRVARGVRATGAGKLAPHGGCSERLPEALFARRPLPSGVCAFACSAGEIRARLTCRLRQHRGRAALAVSDRRRPGRDRWPRDRGRARPGRGRVRPVRGSAVPVDGRPVPCARPARRFRLGRRCQRCGRVRTPRDRVGGHTDALREVVQARARGSAVAHEPLLPSSRDA